MKTLPRKMSDLIDVALIDLRKVERSAKYLINMGTWHATTRGPACEVCFAGAVIAKSLDGAIGEDIQPHDFNSATERKLYALDSLRAGDAEGAWYNLQKKPAERTINRLTQLRRHITPYEVDPVAFRKGMRQFRDDLRAAGF